VSALCEAAAVSFEAAAGPIEIRGVQTLLSPKLGRRRRRRRRRSLFVFIGYCRGTGVCLQVF